MKHMAKITSLDNFQLYQEALDLYIQIFQICKKMPLSKEFSLVDQLKRASLSVCANLAEGYGRKTQRDFAHFVSISLGSCNEVQVYCDVLQKLNLSAHARDLKEKYVFLGKRLYLFRKNLTT